MIYKTKYLIDCCYIPPISTLNKYNHATVFAYTIRKLSRMRR